MDMKIRPKISSFRQLVMKKKSIPIYMAEGNDCIVTVNCVIILEVKGKGGN